MSAQTRSVVAQNNRQKEKKKEEDMNARNIKNSARLLPGTLLSPVSARTGSVVSRNKTEK